MAGLLNAFGNLVRDVVGGGGGGTPAMPAGGAAFPFGGVDPFNETYRVYPVAFINKDSLENGDKIILPTSALEKLARLRVVYPMMFRISNPTTNQSTHTGVMEFSAEEGVAYLPYWVMQNLCVESGGMINVTNVTLKKGSFVTLQPHSTDFIKLSNPRVILEKCLRTFTVLTKGDTIRINVDGITYYLDVLECKPQDAISVIETDVQVDFAAPKDYKEEDHKVAPRTVVSTPSSPAVGPSVPPNGGQLVFDHKTEPTPSSSAPTPTASSGTSDYFAKLGSGYTLKGSKKGKGKSKGKRKRQKTGTPTGPSPAPSPAAGPAPTPAAPTPIPSGAPQRPKRIIKDEGNFRYIYEQEPGKAPRLIRRLPKPKETGTKNSPFAGKGYSLV